MTGLPEHLLGRMVAANNRSINSVDSDHPNPRPVRSEPWAVTLGERWPAIRAEWDGFVAGGCRLPLIEEVVDEHQGNEGEWRVGLLVSRGRPVDPLARLFPAASAALAPVPGLRSALWSQLGAGTELPEHVGPNAGVLRYHLGVRCGEGSALRVGSTVVPFRDREGVLFDDTVPHEAWNRGDEPRVTLFCEVLRPLPRGRAAANRLVQRIISLDPRYRRAPSRAARLHDELNSARIGR